MKEQQLIQDIIKINNEKIVTISWSFGIIYNGWHVAILKRRVQIQLKHTPFFASFSNFLGRNQTQKQLSELFTSLWTSTFLFFFVYCPNSSKSCPVSQKNKKIGANASTFFLEKGTISQENTPPICPTGQLYMKESKKETFENYGHNIKKKKTKPNPPRKKINDIASTRA